MHYQASHSPSSRWNPDFEYKIVGSNNVDNLSGSAQNDYILGGSGDDEITSYSIDLIYYTICDSSCYTDAFYGYVCYDTNCRSVTYGEGTISNDGADILAGGTGSDTYNIFYTDVISERSNQGIDTVNIYADETSLSSIYQLDNNIENAVMFDSLQGMIGNRLDNSLTGSSNDNYLAGQEGDDAIFGLDGDDILVGGKGSDTLTGGSGADVFLFDTKPKGDADEITDFVVTEDSIQLHHRAFKLQEGQLSSDMFKVVGDTLDQDDRIIYDGASGELYFDKDGVGIAPMELIVTLPNMPNLAADNIFIV